MAGERSEDAAVTVSEMPCPDCRGSGEGRWEDDYCLRCGGSGQMMPLDGEA